MMDAMITTRRHRLAMPALAVLLGVLPTAALADTLPATKRPPLYDRERERVMAEPGWRPWQRWQTCVDGRGVRFRCLCDFARCRAR
jgi:hypothetical protein